MMGLLIRLVAGTIAVLVASYLLAPDYFAVSDLVTAIILALVLGLLNAIVRPILTLLTLPLTIVTLGLFLIVVNALMVKLVDWVIPGIRIEGFVAAIFTTIIIWFTSLVANAVFGGELKGRPPE